MSLRVNSPYWLGSVLITCSGLLGAQASAQSVTITYDYDALGRLTDVSDTASGDTAFAYDAAGNRMSVSAGSPPPPPPPPPPPNTPPVALNPHYFSASGQTWVFNASQVATDADGDTLTFTSVSRGALSNGNQTWQFLFLIGPSVTTFTVSDGHGGSASGTITIEAEGGGGGGGINP
jgi:YD repeat-containing protein